MKPVTFRDINCPTGNCRVQPSLWAAQKVDIRDLQLQDSSHPNVLPFNGTLLLLDEASDQPPHGAEGHPIYVPTRVAKERLNTLPGMAINYQSDLTGHNPSKKVGVITKASIDGNKVRVSGLVWKKDFPEAARVFKQNRGRLGMSMELGDVYVRDKDESVWYLEDFHFTGATVLLKDHAAYEATDLAASKYFVKALAAASAARGIFRKGGKPEMADKNKEVKKNNGQSDGTKLVASISAAFEASLTKVMGPLLKKQEENNTVVREALESISASQEELVKGLHEVAIQAAGGGEVEDIEADASDATMAAGDATMAADSSKDASDATQDSTDATNDSSDATMDAETAGTDEFDPTNVDSTSQDDAGSGSTPGDLNKQASAHAKRNARSGAGGDAKKAGGKGMSKGIAAARVGNIAAAGKVIRTLNAQLAEQREDNRRLKNRVKAMEASVERFAERVERKSITPEISALLEKNGYDVRELMASKTRLTVAEVDNIMANAGVNLDPTTRMAFKNQLLQGGYMEQGQVTRYQN